MSIELTAFELLAMPEDHPIKQLYAKEQAEKAAVWRTDFCRQEAMGAVCLHYALELVVPETVVEPEIETLLAAA